METKMIRIGQIGGGGKSMLALSMAVAYCQEHKIPLERMVSKGVESDHEGMGIPVIAVVPHPSNPFSEEMALAMSRHPSPVIVACESFSDANLLRGKFLPVDMVKPIDFIQACGKKKGKKKYKHVNRKKNRK